MPSLLISEPPLQVLPSLAVRIGLNEAIVVQQLYWLLQNKSNGREIDGDRWIFNTYEQWREYFPFWGVRTLERIFSTLQSMHIVEFRQPDGRVSRRKYYRLNHGTLHLMLTGKIPEPATLADSDDGVILADSDPANLAAWEPATLADSFSTKTSAETSTKTSGVRRRNGKSIPSIPSPSSPPKARGSSPSRRRVNASQDEVVAHAVSIGLSREQGRKMFLRFEGHGWPRGCWKAVVALYKAEGWVGDVKKPVEPRL